MADEHAFHNQPPQKSGGAGVLLWILGIGAVCLVVCCGAFGVMAWKFKGFVENMAVDDPAQIRRQTAEMADITIPDKYQPKQGMNMGFVRVMAYETDPAQDGSHGNLMLMEMAMQQFGVDQQQQEQELRKAMKQQQQQGNQQFKSSKSETREIEIRGEKITFEFTEGTTDGPQGGEKKTYMVNGVFPGKRGGVGIQVILPEDEYDEQEVMEMLQSIK